MIIENKLDTSGRSSATHAQPTQLEPGTGERMARKGTIGECTPNIDCLLLVNGRPCEYTACTRTEGERGYSANVNRKQASKVLVVVSCLARWRSAPSIGAHTNRSPPPAKAGLCGRAVTNIWAKGTRCLTSWRVNTRVLRTRRGSSLFCVAVACGCNSVHTFPTTAPCEGFSVAQ